MLLRLTHLGSFWNAAANQIHTVLELSSTLREDAPDNARAIAALAKWVGFLQVCASRVVKPVLLYGLIQC
jgi:hypothetical protein